MVGSVQALSRHVCGIFGSRRLLVPVVALVAGLLAFPAAAPAIDYDAVPILNVSGSGHLLGQSVDLDIDAEHLDMGGAPERLVVSTPYGYGVNLVHSAGTNIGFAFVATVPSTGNEDETLYFGDLIAMDASAYAASPSAQACAPGVHTAVWMLQVSTLDDSVALGIPIAVDAATGGGYTLTMCFDDERAKGLVVTAVDFDADETFTNPATAGRYVFTGLVTPFAADGTPSPATAYEFRAYEDLPQTLTASATYRVATKTFTVTGVLRAVGAPRTGINVHVWAGQTSVPRLGDKDAGLAVTKTNGSYVFTKRLARAPAYSFTYVNHYWGAGCAGVSSAPSGCVSYTIDGRDSNLAKVRIIPAPKRR
jgi:hypothetical protein